ncbi:hypothetical protein ACN38_g10689 [Penicillium nordicum]|uniref:Uncharacterized protein n=1 Tax=Penicillium nordicum TaxID=229535 RepID=A0A0M8NW15_9EURO|nr:hypothetical protein ACN38_g10689 [Penicillium nordicum]
MFSEDVSLGDDFEFRQLAADDSRNHDDVNWAELILEFTERWERLRFRSLQWLERIEDALTIRGERMIHAIDYFRVAVWPSNILQIIFTLVRRSYRKQ